MKDAGFSKPFRPEIFTESLLNRSQSPVGLFVIKDICPGADEVIIVTSSLMKDMNSKTDLYRANSIRVLCKITDSGLLAQVSTLEIRV